MSSGISTVYPSAICRTGPMPLTRFILLIVTCIPPLERNCEEKPPPRKYSKLAGHHLVAARHFSTSPSLTSQYGFITGFPFLDCLPVPSRAAEPEFKR